MTSPPYSASGCDPYSKRSSTTCRRDLTSNRDLRLTQKSRVTLSRGGISLMWMPPRSPNLNAYADLTQGLRCGSEPTIQMSPSELARAETTDAAERLGKVNGVFETDRTGHLDDSGVGVLKKIFRFVRSQPIGDAAVAVAGPRESTGQGADRGSHQGGR